MTTKTSWCIVISWQSPDVDAWIYGLYDHKPMQNERAVARSSFMENTTTSENDWDEYGCELIVSALTPPPQKERA